jgi:hypothetical protein
MTRKKVVKVPLKRDKKGRRYITIGKKRYYIEAETKKDIAKQVREIIKLNVDPKVSKRVEYKIDPKREVYQQAPDIKDTEEPQKDIGKVSLVKDPVKEEKDRLTKEQEKENLKRLRNEAKNIGMKVPKSLSAEDIEYLILMKTEADNAGVKVKPEWGVERILEELEKEEKALTRERKVAERREKILQKIAKFDPDIEPVKDFSLEELRDHLAQLRLAEDRKIDPLALTPEIVSEPVGEVKSEEKKAEPLPATVVPVPPVEPSATGGGSVDKDGLSNIQIDGIMKPYPEYLGTISSDGLGDIIPKIAPKSRGGVVINTKPSSHRGEHWQALFWDGRPQGSNSIEFYDSYGDPAPKHVLNAIEDIAERLDANTYLKFKENTVHKQGDSSNCGFFATKFLIDRFRGISFREATGYIDMSGKGEREIESFRKQVGFGYVSSFAGQRGGIFGNLIDRFKSAFFPKSEMPSPVKALIAKFGPNIIRSISIRRAPVVPMVEKFLNVISLGKYEKGKAEMAYDKMFHLSMVITFTSGQRILLEKNERINISTSFSDTKDTEYKPVNNYSANSLTMNTLLKATEDYMGTFKFYQYNAFENNCQDFILGILKANRINSPEVEAFVKQDVGTIVKRLPSFVGKISQFATDSWARIKSLVGRGYIDRKILKGELEAIRGKGYDKQTIKKAIKNAIEKTRAGKKR